MLSLPDDWRDCIAATSARAILSQADDLREYRTAARLLARACFELLRDTLWGNVEEGGPEIHFEERVIRINDHAFLIADAANDSLLDEAIRLRRKAPQVDVLAPPGTRVLITEALASLRCSRVTVQAIDQYVELRVQFTGMDTHSDRPTVLADLLLRYSELCERNAAPHLAVSCDGLRPLPPEQAQRARRRRAEERQTESSRAQGSLAVLKPKSAAPKCGVSMQTCELCGAKWDNEDGWDGLCPECADLVSNLLDELRLTGEDRDEIVERLRAVVQRTLEAHGVVR
jgi:hypothetical protein